MEMLFTAKWNIPQAARNLEVSDDLMKQLFRDYCKDNGPHYDERGNDIRTPF